MSNNALWDLLKEQVGKGQQGPLHVSAKLETHHWRWLASYVVGQVSGRYPDIQNLQVFGLREIVGDEPSREHGGAWRKRFVAALYKELGVKLTANEKDRISQHLQLALWETDLRYDFTDTFDWKAGDFADDGSCFFTNRYGRVDRFALQHAGALAIRFYDAQGKKGTGRAWVVPSEMVYTSSSVTSDALGAVFFNVYGYSPNIFNQALTQIFEAFGPARIWTDSLYGLPRYHEHYDTFKVINQRVCGIYVNSSCGFFVGDESKRPDEYWNPPRYLAVPYPPSEAIPTTVVDTDAENHEDDEEEEEEDWR